MTCFIREGKGYQRTATYRDSKHFMLLRVSEKGRKSRAGKPRYCKLMLHVLLLFHNNYEDKRCVRDCMILVSMKEAKNRLFCCRNKMIPLVLMAVTLGITQALDNGLARTPPMGWLSWERFRCNVDCEKDPENCISESLFKKMADLMVSEGYRDAGYTYLCIDDCWAAMEREPNGSLVADPKRFPSGIRALADYVHAKGLKLGIYGDFGRKTCGGYPGSEFYLQQDAETFASWQVDLLKLDGCQSEPIDDDIGYPVMEFYLNRTGRPILFSCSWPVYQMEHNMTTNYTSVAHTCNTWRNYEDIQDSFDSVLDILDFWGNNSGDFLNLTGPGSFSDPDMLIIGNFGLSPGQERIQMGMWALLAAPLYMSVDLRSIRRESKELLQNKRVIALNNDKLGYPARRVLVSIQRHAGRFQVWRKMLSTPGAYALGVVNSSDEGMPHVLNTTLLELGLTNPGGYNVTEVFDGAAVGTFRPSDPFLARVNPSDILLVTCTPL